MHPICELMHVWQEAMLLLVAMGAMGATTMATMPMEETTTAATTVGTVALPEATMALGAVPLVVSVCVLYLF